MTLVLHSRLTRQPQYPALLNGAHPLSGRVIGTLWSTGQTFNGGGEWAASGTISQQPCASGVGVKGNGTTGLMSRSISLTGIRPHVLLTVFTASPASTAQKTLYAIGANDSSGGAFSGISAGNGSAAVVIAQSRSILNGDVHTATGPQVISGATYAVAWQYRTTGPTTCGMFVNGVEYDASGPSDHVSSSTLVHESVGALKRGTTSLYSTDTVLFTGRFVPEAGEDLRGVLREWTKNPWSIFAPRHIWIPCGVAGASLPTLSASTYVSGSLTSTGWRPQVAAS